jgi:hypothetical protein
MRKQHGRYSHEISDLNADRVLAGGNGDDEDWEDEEDEEEEEKKGEEKEDEEEGAEPIWTAPDGHGR